MEFRLAQALTSLRLSKEHRFVSDAVLFLSCRLNIFSSLSRKVKDDLFQEVYFDFVLLFMRYIPFFE
jgi:hypothetical protein